MIKTSKRFFVVFLVHGGWGIWSVWGACSPLCGSGRKKMRSRECDKPTPQYGGQACDGDLIETLDCDDYSCAGNNGNL